MQRFVIRLWYLNLRLFGLSEFLVWNIKGIHSSFALVAMGLDRNCLVILITNTSYISWKRKQKSFQSFLVTSVSFLACNLFNICYNIF